MRASILTLTEVREYGPPLDVIMNAVSRALRIGRLDMMSHHRAYHIAEARQIFQWFARTYTARSFPEIGRFCKRDHCTVMHGYRKIERTKAAVWPKLAAVAKELNVELPALKEAA
jgi:chromosomal replication initiation ATPase DnaA